jgi:hypothetical protein
LAHRLYNPGILNSTFNFSLFKLPPLNKELYIYIKGNIKEMEKNIMKLFCTNCGSDFDAVASPRVTGGKLGTEYVCPVCEFYPVWAKEGDVQSLMVVADLQQSIRQTIIPARAADLPVEGIIAVLKSELEFAAEMGDTGHSFLVQVINLGSYENSNGPAPVPESRDSHQNESIYS